MAALTGFGDEMWRLAVAGDIRSLDRAADMLLRDDIGLGYEGHRARAFALAVQRRVADAVAELSQGWTQEWPFPAAYATDVARVRILGGDHAQALDALGLAVRSAKAVDAAVVELATLCVRRERRLWVRATRAVLAGGAPLGRLRNAWAVVRARLGRNA